MDGVTRGGPPPSDATNNNDINSSCKTNCFYTNSVSLCQKMQLEVFERLASVTF